MTRPCEARARTHIALPDVRSCCVFEGTSALVCEPWYALNTGTSSSITGRPGVVVHLEAASLGRGELFGMSAKTKRDAAERAQVERKMPSGLGLKSSGVAEPKDRARLLCGVGELGRDPMPRRGL